MADAPFTPVPSFESHPSRYRHWRLTFADAVATLTLDIVEENGMRSDYLLKQNSYDVGVDIELHDALERLRFEHPEVRCVVVTSGQPKVFCAGANIHMLASSTHHFKVNFCKYTNETRCGVEEALAESGQRWIAALNGTAAGGGYEMALACDQIYLIDDRSSSVSLPEVPLLAVLPGTGGLTRLVDKRFVRRDLADLFCTKAEGFRVKEAKRYGLIDGSFPRSGWDAGIQKVAAEVVAASPARSAQGIVLPPMECVTDVDSRAYKYVRTTIDRKHRTATLIVSAPTSPPPANASALRAEGAETWSLRAFRELDDALCHLRFNEPTIGLVLVQTEGDAESVLAHDASLDGLAGDWLADEIRFFQGRTLRRLDNMSKSMFAIIGKGSCFAGILFELALSVDRSYMLDDPDGEVVVRPSVASSGRFKMQTGLSRLENRFYAHADQLAAALGALGQSLSGADALDLGLVTIAPDDLDWDDEVRIAVEERVSLSPDALTGMEQNLRYVGAENCETKIFGRLTAWQNWIFQRPNAVGEHGALTLYGAPESPRFDWGRT